MAAHAAHRHLDRLGAGLLESRRRLVVARRVSWTCVAARCGRIQLPARARLGRPLSSDRPALLADRPGDRQPCSVTRLGEPRRLKGPGKRGRLRRSESWDPDVLRRGSRSDRRVQKRAFRWSRYPWLVPPTPSAHPGRASRRLALDRRSRRLEERLLPPADLRSGPAGSPAPTPRSPGASLGEGPPLPADLRSGPAGLPVPAPTPRSPGASRSARALRAGRRLQAGPMSQRALVRAGTGTGGCSWRPGVPPPST